MTILIKNGRVLNPSENMDKVMDVLIEGRDTEQENVTYGRSYREAPEVDGQIYVEEDADSKPGDIIRVKVLQGFTYDVVGERIDG